jgi:hypothetical protein
MKRILPKISLASVFVEKSHGQEPWREEMIAVNAGRKSDRQTFQTWEDTIKKTVRKFNLEIGNQNAKRNKMKKTISVFLSQYGPHCVIEIGILLCENSLAHRKKTSSIVILACFCYHFVLSLQ